MRRLARDERGGVLVELALVVPILLLVVFGAWTLLWLAHERSQVSGWTRDAARYASIAHDPFCDEPACGSGYPTEDEVRAYVLDRAGLPADDPIAVELVRAGGGADRNERFTVTVRRQLPNPFRAVSGLFGVGDAAFASSAIGRTE
jgi:hypothetical protein